jgi:TonB-linked SusC/RagA family outer membrane protein
MKKKLKLVTHYYNLYKKYLLIMKLIVLLCIVSLFRVSASVYSQNTSLSLKISNRTIKEVFNQIEEESHYHFLYNDKFVDFEKKVSMEVNEMKITDVLDLLLKGSSSSYKLLDNNLVVIAPKIFMQQMKVTGTVTDAITGETLPGVSISLEGSVSGTITDGKGKYSIDVPDGNAILVFTFIGFNTERITVNNRAIINVSLIADIQKLDEVTVVAFAKQKKESVIGSITTINPKELKIPSSNLTTALGGRISGLIAYQRSGEPGNDNASFFIRGVTTFGYKKDPLILLDNNEITTQELSRMQPDDIASFSIMKDATATSLYGSRGANGVILITTKEGTEGKAQINIRAENTFSMPTSQIKLADPVTYMKLHNEAIRTRNPLAETMYSQNKIDNTIAGGNPYVYPANDWYKLLFKDYAQNQRLNFNLSGGNKIARYYLAGTLNNDNGVLKVDKKNNFNNNIDLKSYMLRSNVSINVTKSTELTVRLQGSFDDYQGPITGGDDIYRQVMKTNPVLFPAYYLPDSANQYTKHILYGNYDKGQYNNPYAAVTRGYKNYSSSQIMAQAELKQELNFITKGLALRGMFNTNRYAYSDVARGYDPFYYDVASYDKSSDTYKLNVLNENTAFEYLGYNEGAKNITSTVYGEGAISWDRTFAQKHAVSGLLVTTIREQQISNAGDLQKSLPYRNLGTAGRFTYAYDSRYFTELNFGYNGSERFSAKERFGFFPSAGVGWMVSNEAFWKEGLKKVINKLKFKATYGLVGNDAIGSADDRFFYLSNVNMNDGGKGAAFGTYGNMGGTYLNGISISRYANDQITWETAYKLNLGVEVTLFESLEIQADVFSEDRKNILMDRSSIPSTMGLQAAVRANVGEATSRGIDMSANYKHSFNKDFWMTGMANFTYATSKFKVYEEPDYSTTPWRNHVGTSLNQMWGYVAERLFVDDNEVRNSPTQSGDVRGGDIKYKDINGDGKIDDQDIVPIGYPTVPEIVYGFGLSCGWKSLDLSCFFQGLARESFYIDATATSPFVDGQNALIKAYADDHWSEDNRNLYALWPRLSPTVNQNNVVGSNWWMRDGSFLRLKSLEAGFTLPQKFVHKMKATNLRIYFNGTNLLTFSKFHLWDSEMGGNGLAYPIQKVLNMGLQLSF